MSNLNLSLLSRGIGQVAGNGQEKLEVFLEPQDYYNMFPQLKARQKYRKKKWKTKTSHSFPLGPLDMDYLNIPSEEQRNQFFLPPIDSRQLSRGTQHTKLTRAGTTARSELVSSPLNVPRTFSTRKGPLLLYSEDLAHKTHEGKIEKRRRRARQLRRLSEMEDSFQLRNISDLSKAILQYGKATNSNEELYLKFLHHRQKDLWARKVRPGFSAKRYISNWSRLWDDNMLNKLKSSGRVSDKTLYRENPFGHSLSTKRRYENLSYIPPPYRLNRSMMQSPGNFGSYEFYRVKPDMIDSGRGTPDSAMDVDQESVVMVPTSPPHHPSPFGLIKTVVHEDGNLKELPYNELRLGEKHEVLTELLATAYAHQLSSREGGRQPEIYEEIKDNASTTTQVDMRRAIESLVSSTKPPSRPGAMKHFQRRASVLTMDLPETESAKDNPSQAKYYTGMLKGGGLTSESTLRRASIATTQPGKEMYVSFPSLPNREHSRATPSRQYSSTTFEGTLPPIPAARDRVTKHSDTGYQTEVLQPDMAEVREGTLSETSSVPNLPPIKVGIKRGSLESRSTREMVHIDKVPEKLPTITMEPPTPLHHLGGGTPQKGTPLQERPEIRATLATAGFEPWQSSTDESLEEDEQGWVQMDEAEILRRAEEEEKLAAAAEKQSEKQSSRRTKSSVRSSVGSLKDEVLEEEVEEEEDEESEIEVDEEDEEEEMEEKIEERLSVVVTPKPKSVAQGKETPASKQGKETPASKSSSSGKKVEKFIIGKIPPPKREKVERIEAPPPTAEDAVLPKKEMGKTLPPKGGGVTPRGAEQKVAAKPKPQKQPSQTSLGENLAELTGDGGRKRRGSGSVAGVSVSGSEKSAKSLVVRSLGEGSIGGGDAGSVKSSHESLAPSHVHQSMRGSQMTSRAAKFSGRSDKKKDGASESGSLRGSIIVAPGGEVVSVGGSVKAASESGRSQQQEEEREDDRMSEDSGHMSEGEEEPVEIQSVASGPSLGSQRASKIYGYAKRQEIDVTGGDFDASAFLSARSVKSDDSKSQKSDEEKDARSQKGSVKSSVSNPNLASNAPSLAPIEDEEEEEEEEEDWAALAKEASDRESLGSRRTSQSLAASQKSLREHAAAIAAAVLQKQGTGLDLGTDAAVAARLWEEVDDVVRLEDLPPRARSADPQPKQRQKEVVHDQDGNEIEVDVLGPLPAVGQLSQKLSRSAGPLVAVVREMKKQAALLGLEGDFEVDEETLQQLKDESLNPEDIEIIQDETTGKKVIRSRRSSKASELSSKHSIAPVAATTSIAAASSGTKSVKSSAEVAPKVSKPAPTTVAKPAAKPSEPLKPDVTNYGKADVPEKEDKPQPPVKEKEEVGQKSRVPLAPVVETKKEAKPSPPPKKEEAPKKVETPKKAEPAKKAEPPKEETPKKVETPKTVKPKKEKVAEKEEPKKEEVKEKAPPKEKESPAKAEKPPKEKEAKKKKKTKSPTKEVEKEEEPETPKKEDTPEPPKSDKAKSSKGSAKSEKSTKSKSSLEDRPTFVIGQPKTEVKAEEPTPVVPQPKKEPVPKAPKAPAAKKGGKKKGKKEKEKKPEEQAAPEAEEEAAPPEEEIVRSPTPEPEEPEPELEPEPEEEEEEVTPPESPAKASSATPSRASPEKTATPALVQPLPFGTVNAPPSTKSEISRDTQSTPEVDTAADEEAAEAAKAAAREKRAQREAARAAAAQKRKEEVERKRKEREDQKRREQEEIERQERMKQELEDERKKRDEDYRRRKEQMEEEKKRQAEEEEKRKQAEVARLERERRQQEEYRRMMAEMQRKKREEEQRKAEIAAEKAREEEERRKEEEEKMAQMEEEERLEYERQKREEEERRRIEEEERRLREEEEARIRMEEAKRLAEQMAKERAILEEKLKFQRGLQSESDNLEHGQNLNPAFTFSYFELLQLLGLQFPTDETDKDVNG